MGLSWAPMSLPGRAKDRSDHELAQQLDLARREQGLTTNELAAALFCSPRTIRRYLNGERRPPLETIVRWEVACGVEPGSLTANHQRPTGASIVRSEPDAATADPERGPSVAAGATRGNRGRFQTFYRLGSASTSALARYTALALVLAGLGVLLILRVANNVTAPATREQPGPSAIALHQFSSGYVGAVWAQITPSPEHRHVDHTVTLRWGPVTRRVLLPRLGPGPRSLVFGKNKPDSVVLRVTVQPPARIAFGEGLPPGNDPLDINDGWTKSR